MEVTVTIPDERLAEFYLMLGRFLSSRPPVQTRLSSPGAGPAKWTADDHHLAQTVWERLTDTAKAFFSILIDSPGTQFTGEDLAEQIGANRRLGAAGVLSWPSRYCDDVGRELCWKWGYLPAGTGDTFCRYWMTDELAALFRDARDQARPRSRRH